MQHDKLKSHTKPSGEWTNYLRQHQDNDTQESYQTLCIQEG
jgi:hypothetical protein